MWPYCKSKEYETDEARCPRCGEVSKGLYQAGELIMAEFCRRCKSKEAYGDKPADH